MNPTTNQPDHNPTNSRRANNISPCSCVTNRTSGTPHSGCDGLRFPVRTASGWLRVWHRRGWFSPAWLSRLPSWAAKIVPPSTFAYPVFDWALRKGSEARLSVFMIQTAIALGVSLFWWWACKDASAREDLRDVALYGLIATPAGDLLLDDLVQNPGQTSQGLAFLPRRLRRFNDRNASASLMEDSIPSLLPTRDGDARRVAIIGVAGMGKTRLIHQLIRQLPPETMVFAPSRSLKGRTDAELRRATRFLRKKECVLVFDDLNFYVGNNDVGALERVVADQTSRCAVAVTCSTSKVLLVRSDQDPGFSRFFSGLEQYELLRMTDEQMETLVSDPAAPTLQHHPRHYGGNPGHLLLDFQHLWEAYQSLSNQETAVLQAIHVLFTAGVSPIQHKQVRALSSFGYGGDLATSTVDRALERLRSMSFIRAENPVLPEESLLIVIVVEHLARERMDEGLEQVLWNLGEATALFQLADSYYLKGDIEGTARIMSMVFHLDRLVGTPTALTRATAAKFNLGIALTDLGRPPQDIEAAYREAAEVGHESGTPGGKTFAAKALYNLGIALKGWAEPSVKIEASYREAAEAGRRSGTPEGLLQTAKALVNLGIAFRGWKRSHQEIETTYREAAEAGRQSGTPQSLAETAKALYNLGFALMSWKRSHQEIETTYREAAEAGRRSGTPEGLVQSAKALVNLGVILQQRGRSPHDIETAWKAGAQAGRESGTPEGLVETGKALINLGVVLEDWGRSHQEIKTTYREAAEAGRESGTPEGTAITARAVTNLRKLLEGPGA